jgi:hypothetical protein
MGLLACGRRHNRSGHPCILKVAYFSFVCRTPACVPRNLKKLLVFRGVKNSSRFCNRSRMLGAGHSGHVVQQIQWYQRMK